MRKLGDSAKNHLNGEIDDPILVSLAESVVQQLGQIIEAPRARESRAYEPLRLHMLTGKY